MHKIETKYQDPDWAQSVALKDAEGRPLFEIGARGVGRAP